MAQQTSPRVFVSYSWDTPSHQTWVRELCARLVSNGVNVRLDEWLVPPGASFLQFMEQECIAADVVLVVCSQEYVKRANEREGGVGFESQILSAGLLANSKARVIPLVVGQMRPTLPTFLVGRRWLTVSHQIEDREFEEVVRAVFDAPRNRRPAIGEFPSYIRDALGGERTGIDYTSPLDIDFEVLEVALDTIQSLARPAVWGELRATRDGLWIRSTSELLVATLYGLWAPMALADARQRSYERRMAGFARRERTQALLLLAASAAFVDDDVIAGLHPRIDYSPRVSGWRRLRQEDPARYWWQGLSIDRKSAAVALFKEDSSPDSDQLIDGASFREVFLRAAASSDQEQQTIGLAANALFDFTPATRPVFWRLLVVQFRLYLAILRLRSLSTDVPETLDDLVELTSVRDRGVFPRGGVVPDAESFERMESVDAAATQYISSVVVPRVLARLA